MSKRISDPILEEGIGSISKRLELLRAQEDMSARQFAIKLGVSEGALRKINSGSIPNVQTAAKIANSCGVSLDWFVTGVERDDEDKRQAQLMLKIEQALNSNTNQIDNETEKLLYSLVKNALAGFDAPESRAFLHEVGDDFVLVPGYHIQVSAGSGCSAFDQEPKRWLAFRKKYFEYRHLNPDRCAVVFVKGDSMADTITDNDSLLIDLDSTTPIDGHIYVVRLGDELYAKRLQKSYDGSLILISDNKDYSPITVPKIELDQLCIVGKVVQRATDL
ncbi:XRE family transcriptional regulator [Vibrio mediterranei]|uniref:XRE family transcriptional regulator n=1 Tax=Vibrio mediterranei TaxID=689 RepID=UPI001EFCF26F|nr:XRE family transcriptional regulator [Vibrio mediterranei]MCG9624604.1 XRE family transcriptional regulator [Vibrio mediterranei]